MKKSSLTSYTQIEPYVRMFSRDTVYELYPRFLPLVVDVSQFFPAATEIADLTMRQHATVMRANFERMDKKSRRNEENGNTKI